MTQVLCEFCGRHYQIEGQCENVRPSADGAYHLECCDQCVTEYSNQKFKEAQEIDWLRRLYALKDKRIEPPSVYKFKSIGRIAGQ